ncbi:RNI-like protein [Phanerochaete sordida]|uniref:RNI-like protein n=1 Tax=Phanerochaete sordida TaxID=48140 RepID=A0A9P3GEX0_9APHY|nr:RNI-like protein [Phanerochaete sordida]
MSSSPSPSSSAVTIPTPGKSILKKPPPAPQSFFSLGRLSKLLPTQNTTSSNDSNDESRTLKRAHFILPEIATVYPIYASNPPCTPTLKDEKRSIEEREAERRRRVVRRNSVTPDATSPEEHWWSVEQVESFYRECCVGREEAPDGGISAAILRAKGPQPRTVDLSGVQLTVGSAAVLSDVFTIEWGLRKLVMKECDLDEHILKPILHSLLIPSSLTFLSVASNRRLKAGAFKLIGAYVSKAKSLQFLDLSQNALDKKSIEYIAASLQPAPAPGLVSLRLDDCSLKPQALDALAHAVRVSSLRNISLRYNKINATGAVAVALMIRDYPDRFPIANGSTSSIASPTSSTASFLSPPATPSIPSSPVSPEQSLPPPPPPRTGPILPPPRHPSAAPLPQTTYTPYIPKARRAALAAVRSDNSNPLLPGGQQVPLITSSAQGGITARHPVPPPYSPTPNSPQPNNGHGPSAALLDKVRALDALPRLGALRTLDLRGNDIRMGVTYIAQVLKRNRTLKVLNLSENKLDVQALVAMAEALKYNSSLETLDLSKNPCCGPSLEGVQSLRTAFTLNSALKRLFLSSTSLTSPGAIALAEFLPESTSLLHLDLTMNNLDIAGVMALSSGLKANHVMRCLDLNIPPGDEEMARMCREILNTCVRNTEEADKASQANSDTASMLSTGKSRALWLMIEESELAKTFRQDEQKKVEAPDPGVPSSLASSQAPTDSLPSPLEQKDTDSILQNARVAKAQLEECLADAKGEAADPVMLDFARTVLRELGKLVQHTDDAMNLGELLHLNDEITALVARCTPRRPTLGGLGIRLESGRPVAENGVALGADLHPEEDEPTTPRIDKGKGRAEPEPEPVEPVLSPTAMGVESDEEVEVDESLLGHVESIVSPTDRSRSWVAEEGEVFRKGAVLLTPEEMENEYDSEELRKELLEAMVERPPPRALQEYDPLAVEGQGSPMPSPSLESPPKPMPRPYVRRSRSSSSMTSPHEGPLSPSIPGTLQEAV